MIVRLTGTLVEVLEDSAVVDRMGLCYEVLVPRFSVAALAGQRGLEVTMHTLDFIEAGQNASYFTPRLIGFVTPEDRAFFQKFINVKGMGLRKALRALSEPAGRIASWIQEGDAKALARLSGIGPRGAQLIVAELRGKLGDFAFASGGGGAVVETSWTEAQRDALTILMDWGDSRADAERYLAAAAEQAPEIDDPAEWVRAAYQAKASVGRA